MPTFAVVRSVVAKPYVAPTVTFTSLTSSLDGVRKFLDLFIDGTQFASLFWSPLLTKDLLDRFQFTRDLTRTLHSLRTLLEEENAEHPLWVRTNSHALLMHAMTIYAFAASHLTPSLAGKVNQFVALQVKAAASHVGSQRINSWALQLTSFKVEQVATAVTILYFSVEAIKAGKKLYSDWNNDGEPFVNNVVAVTDPILQLLRRVGGFSPNGQLTLNALSSYLQIL